SMALLFRGRLWAAAVVQAVSILVHENALLVGFPVFCVAWLLVAGRGQESDRSFAVRWRLWPLLVPIAAFLLLVVAQSVAPTGIEHSLTAYLSTYPFIARTIGDVRVPHWITITFFDSYVLHQGQFLGRLFSQSMMGIVLLPLAAILAAVYDANGIRAASARSMIVL